MNRRFSNQIGAGNVDFLLHFILFPLGAGLMTGYFEAGIWLFFLTWLALSACYYIAKKDEMEDDKET